MVVLLGKLIDGNDGGPLVLIDVIKNTDLEQAVLMVKN